MKRCVLIIVLIALACGTLGLLLGFTQIDLSALPEPGHLETVVATRVKRALVRRSSREGIPPAPANVPASAAEGAKLFGSECAACHGLDGHKLTDSGRWMYPRASDLTSPEVQQYSDRELFWIVKNGIRLSGMPAFGKVESDEHIWNLVHYVRTLPANANPK